MAAPQPRNDPGARPAEALLASQLVSDEELDELLEGICGIGVRKRRDGAKALRTGVKSLDDALDGGLQGGRVVGISSEVGAGGSEICRAFLVSSLLKYHNSAAAVIDTTGNFDILRLYALILSQLQQNPDILSSLRLPAATSGSDLSVEDAAAKVLDRVKIMRVFDLVGVREAVGEVRDELEGKKVMAPENQETKENIREEEELVVHAPPKRTVVADSEDEESDDEMLFDSEAAITGSVGPVQDPDSRQNEALKRVENEQEQTGSEEAPSKVKFILIDNLAQVLNPLLKKDYIQANALATTFLRTLTNLTHTHNLHTILLNSTTSLRPPSPARPPQANQPAPPPQQQSPPPPSIFASSTAVPSLMNVLARHTDANFLITRIPKRKLDARVCYSDAGSGGNRGAFVKKRGVEMVNVLEIVSDQWEGRVGAWGTFVEGKEGIRDVS